MPLVVQETKRSVIDPSDDAAQSTFAEVDNKDRITPAMEFQDVYLSFDEKVILKGLSFRVLRGETKIILGGSGGGKSTIIKLVLGLLKPDSGRILVDGEDITDYNEVHMMSVRKEDRHGFQEGAIFDPCPSITRCLSLHEQGVPEEEVETEVRRMLRFVNLEDAIDKCRQNSPEACAAESASPALIGDPKIVLFDEPTAGRDPPTARTICELAMKLRDLEDVRPVRDSRVNNLDTFVRIRGSCDEGKVVFEREGERLCLPTSKVM